MFNKKRIIKDNDRLFQEILRKHATGQCQLCGNIGSAGHHIYKNRRFMWTRWTITNGIYLCQECHLQAHGDPKGFKGTMMVYEIWNELIEADIIAKANQSGKPYPLFYEYENKKLKALLGGY